jgi:hypothetical protein
MFFGHPGKDQRAQERRRCGIDGRGSLADQLETAAAIAQRTRMWTAQAPMSAPIQPPTLWASAARANST